MERIIPTIGVLAAARPRRAPSPGALIAAAIIAVSCLWPCSIAARPMAMVDSYPMVDQIMDGNATSFALRFDAPIDHAGARLILLTPQGPRTLRARLGSRPNTLFAAVGTLEPGAYALAWRARSQHGDLAAGTIPFRIAPR